MRRALIVTSVALAALLSPAFGDDEKVSPDKIPKEVLAAIKAHFAKAKLVAAVETKVKDDKAYRVQLDNKSSEVYFTATPGGKVLAIEETIASEALPTEVRDAVEKEYPKAKRLGSPVKLTQGEGKEEVISYQLLVEPREKEVDIVTLSPKGKILSVIKGL